MARMTRSGGGGLQNLVSLDGEAVLQIPPSTTSYFVRRGHSTLADGYVLDGHGWPHFLLSVQFLVGSYRPPCAEYGVHT
jgi:hypothetical protein